MFTKKLITILAVVLFAGNGLYAVPVDKIFTSSGQINDGDTWGNVSIYGNETVVDMFGGWIASATTYDESTFNISAGSIDGYLTCTDSSLVNIYGGWFDFVVVEDSSILHIIDGIGGLGDLSATGGFIYLHAYDVTYNPTGGYYGEGHLEGKYWNSDNPFDYDLHAGTYSHIIIVPEPTTLLLLGLGGLLLRKK